MDGRRTALILGAGASFCYEDGDGPLPLQKDIVGRLPRISVASGEGAPDFVGPNGLGHSRALAKALHGLFGMPEDSSPDADRTSFWEELRRRGKTLETVYAELDQTVSSQQRWVLEDFAAILRTSVRQPIPTREVAHVCRHHRRLASALEPGDYIVTFNWDSLMADALLYYCPFWYPRTGFGPWQTSAIMAMRSKSFSIQSLVQLFHIHGSVLLFELLEGGPNSSGTTHYLYLGPPGYSEGNNLMAILGVSNEHPEPTRNPSEDEQAAVAWGYLHIEGRWFKPVFVPPSFNKGEYVHPYHQALRSRIHALLPTTERYVIIGYSIPEADIDHLSTIFVPTVMRTDAEVRVVDPSAIDSAFQGRVHEIFPKVKSYDFGNSNFKTFASAAGDDKPSIFA